MKKTFIIIICLLLLVGCTSKEEKPIKKETKKEKEIVEKDTYKDQNNTPIGIYELKGNQLVKVHDYITTFTPDQDINLFQIYPSSKETVTLNESFAKSFYNEWNKYSNIKQGFNIKFTLDTNESISYNILTPDNTFDKWEYLLNYLYDDYINSGKSSYSHLEMKDYNKNTLYTAFKMQSSGYVNKINSNIKLSAFTYDTEDDFKDNEYRGNSIYTINICNNNCI